MTEVSCGVMGCADTDGPAVVSSIVSLSCLVVTGVVDVDVCAVVPLHLVAAAEAPACVHRRSPEGRRLLEEDVDAAADRLISTVRRLREMSPLYEMAQEGIDLSEVKWDAH